MLNVASDLLFYLAVTQNFSMNTKMESSTKTVNILTQYAVFQGRWHAVYFACSTMYNCDIFVVEQLQTNDCTHKSTQKILQVTAATDQLLSHTVKLLQTIQNLWSQRWKDASLHKSVFSQNAYHTLYQWWVWIGSTIYYITSVTELVKSSIFTSDRFIYKAWQHSALLC